MSRQPTQAELRHLARLEQAVNVYTPKLWAKTAPLLLRWLRAVLATARSRLESLVITRALDPETAYILGVIQNASMTVGNPVDQQPAPDLSPVFEELASELALHYGFLASDPRRDDIVRYTQGILEDDLSSYWQSLTSPQRLAEKLQGLREQGLSYVEQTRALDRDYRSGFYRAERLVRSSYNSSANYANYTQMAEFYDALKWLTARDNRVRPSRKGEFFDHRHADGQTVPVGQPFIVSGERLRFPGDRSLGASAGNIVNCRCTISGVHRKPAKPRASSPGRLASVPTSQLRPSGIPVSQALEIEPTSRSKVGRAARHALEAVDSVHGDGKLPSIPVKPMTKQTALGEYRYQRGGKATDIRLSTKGNRLELTSAHEIGHFLDHQGVGEGRDFASRQDSRLDPWRQAVQGSQAVSELQALQTQGYVKLELADGSETEYPVDRRYVRYLLYAEELWARAYAQYITTRSGDHELTHQLAAERNPHSPYKAKQWLDDDFKPIAEALDRLFEELGWLKSRT